MAGTVVASTINNDTGLFSTNNAYLGIAKAWVQFGVSGTTPTVNGSFNISSITRTGTGIYTASFTTAMANINYSAIGTMATTTAGSGLGTVSTFANAGTFTAPTTSTFYASFGNASVGYAEPTLASLAVFGS